jgi:hypothetical protein
MELAEDSGELRKSNFLRSAIAVPKLFLVCNSAIDMVVRHVVELRTLIADAHFCKVDTRKLMCDWKHNDFLFYK